MRALIRRARAGGGAATAGAEHPLVRPAANGEAEAGTCSALAAVAAEMRAGGCRAQTGVSVIKYGFIIMINVS